MPAPRHVVRVRDTSSAKTAIVIPTEDVPQGAQAVSEVLRLIESEFQEPSRTREFSNDEMRVSQVSGLIVDGTISRIPTEIVRIMRDRTKAFGDRVDVGVLYARFESAAYRERKGVLEISKQEMENSYLPDDWKMAPMLVVKFVMAESPMS